MGNQITYLSEEDIFTANAQILVNPVNCEGVMGKGLAEDFKRRYPEMFRIYQQQCRTKELRIGRPKLFTGSQPWILNFPTKEKAHAPSTPEFLEQGLAYVLAHYERAKMQSIAFPKLGCGEGKLSWKTVGPLMARVLTQMTIPTSVYIAQGDLPYQVIESPPLTIGQEIPLTAVGITILEGTPDTVMLVQDTRWTPPLFYSGRDGRIHGILVHEEEARMLYTHQKHTH